MWVSMRVLAISAIGSVLMSGAALADHGKAGLWQVTTTTHMTGAASMNRTFSSQHCMTEAEVKSDTIPQSRNKQCQMTNEKVSGSTFSADMVCTGEAKGSGHMTVTYDTNSHYAGQLAMTTDAGGQKMHMTNTFEGKWVSADCGKVTH